jgi:carbamoyltransferase
VCLAGGVALNAKANGLIAELDFVDDLFIQPAAADDGAALGAALYPHLRVNGALPSRRMDSTYLGPSFSDDEIRDTLESCRIRHEALHGSVSEIAQELARGNTIGLFQGRMEFGPRALGNRSIIADPRSPGIRDRINASVKHREPWRPFAPAILQEQYRDYVAFAAESPFMQRTHSVKPERRNDLAAAVHVDGTVRAQSISPSANPRFHRIVEEFGKLTGVPAVLNTSFNMAGEPIVCTPVDALRTFFTSGLDVLAIGDYLVRKG